MNNEYQEEEMPEVQQEVIPAGVKMLFILKKNRRRRRLGVRIPHNHFEMY